jgi:hypothetical protein
VKFAVDHHAHFEVMYRPELYRPDTPEIRAARAATAVLLYGTEKTDAKQFEAGVAAWAIVHGLATLWLDGSLPRGLGDDPRGDHPSRGRPPERQEPLSQDRRLRLPLRLRFGITGAGMKIEQLEP